MYDYLFIYMNKLLVINIHIYELVISNKLHIIYLL